MRNSTDFARLCQCLIFSLAEQRRQIKNVLTRRTDFRTALSRRVLKTRPMMAMVSLARRHYRAEHYCTCKYIKRLLKSQILLGSSFGPPAPQKKRAGSNRGFVQPAENRGECDESVGIRSVCDESAIRCDASRLPLADLLGAVGRARRQRASQVFNRKL